jgi:mono/diheme cytochrome c family protein
VFASAGCTGCHTLADAGSTGQVGPNLDAAKPSASLVVERVTNGQGAMPSFRSKLNEAQIQAVAAYVAAVAGK